MKIRIQLRPGEIVQTDIDRNCTASDIVQRLKDAGEIPADQDYVLCYTLYSNVKLSKTAQLGEERFVVLKKVELTPLTVRSKGEEMAQRDPRKVFVVHGRNEKARKEMFTLLRAIGLKPIEWSQAVDLTGKPSPYIGDVLESAFSVAQAIVVLLTGDDEGRLRSEYHTEHNGKHETKLTPQARQNVLFEAGMAFAMHRDRTVLVQLGEMRPFSDVSGIHVVRLDNSAAKRKELAQRLENAGCEVDTKGNDWLQSGDFSVSP
ncbi:MAG TPA: nucleotide-binding protein [Anaerolineae bacterium]|nr:nucleotide-binding protein [Anaerolineae bacterium]